MHVEGAEFIRLLKGGKLGDPWTVDDTRRELREGNARYLPCHKEPEREPTGPELKAFATADKPKKEYKPQRPLAVILSCADSRASPEIIFSQEQGRLFVLRSAGNTADSKVIANITYAISALEVPLIVVMGHQACGAVDEALAWTNGGERNACLAPIIDPIMPAVLDRNNRDERTWLADTVKKNVHLTVGALRKASCLNGAGRKFAVEGAYYHFTTGMVEFLKDQA